MINQKLFPYIEKNLESGFTDKQIRDAFIKKGFKKDDVNDSVDFVVKKKKSVSKAPVSNPASTSAQYPYAGFWIRLSAAIWDFAFQAPVIILLLSLIMIAVIKGQVIDGSSSLVNILITVTYLFIGGVAVLYIYLEGAKGWTPGKWVLGLRVFNEKYETIGFLRAFLRHIGKQVSGIILGIGFLMIIWDPKKQGLHDKIAGTYVYKTKGDRKLWMWMGLIGFSIVPFILIGSIAYLGVLSPQVGNLNPSKCVFPA